MAGRRHSLLLRGAISRSEYDDTTRKSNSMADNQLSRELAELARAQRVVSRDLAFERKSLEKNIKQPKSQRRDSMPVLSTGRRLSLSDASHHHHHDLRREAPPGGDKVAGHSASRPPRKNAKGGSTRLEGKSTQRQSTDQPSQQPAQSTHPAAGPPTAQGNLVTSNLLGH